MLNDQRIERLNKLRKEQQDRGRKATAPKRKKSVYHAPTSEQRRAAPVTVKLPPAKMRAKHEPVNQAYRAAKADILRRYHKNVLEFRRYIARERVGLLQNYQAHLIPQATYRRGDADLERQLGEQLKRFEAQRDRELHAITRSRKGVFD